MSDTREVLTTDLMGVPTDIIVESEKRADAIEITLTALWPRVVYDASRQTLIVLPGRMAE